VEVIVSLPSGAVVEVQAADVPDRGAWHRVAAPVLKVTVPVGDADPDVAVTVA
jgi:hypothetical protein